jgi:CRISPR-associated endonuclease/helicase Cas3
MVFIKPMAFYAHTPPEGSDDFHPLKAHLSKVAKKAEEFADKFQAGKIAYYAGLWHDLGKYNPEFQKYLEQCQADTKAGIKTKRRGTPHAIYGAILADEQFSFIAPIIYGHHSGLPDFDDLDLILEDAADEDSKWAKIYEQIITSAEKEMDDLYPTENLEDYLERLPQDPLFADVFYRLLFSCLIDADHLDTESHFNKNKAELRQSYKRKNIAELWSTFTQESQQKYLDSNVNLIREEVYQACIDTATQTPGIFKLAVPTGGGKTRSGLAFALKHAEKYKLDRIIVAVPYTSIIEQTVAVYRDILGDESVLEHHSAVKAEFVSEKDDEFNQADEGAQQYQAQARLVTQNWDAPLIVTTTVQLFESLFSNRSSKCRKLHNIVNSVIILDEVQTLPIKLLQPIVNMLEELVKNYNVSVVLCTATQPALDSISGYFKGFDRTLMRDIIDPDRSHQMFQQLKRVQYNTLSIQQNNKWSWDDLKNNLQNLDRALVILNTRQDALDLLISLEVKSKRYSEIELPETLVNETLKESKILHLSTLLCGAHRQAILAEVKKRLSPKNSQHCLLISTQVVEAGVDLDFPTVYRALAPLDRIIQAAGRCNREGKRLSKESQVFVFEAGSIPKGEYKIATNQTKDLLKNSTFDFHDPIIFKSYFDKLYMLKSVDAEKIEELRAKHNFREVASKFKLIDDNSVSIVIPYNEKVKKLLRDTKKQGLQKSNFRQLQPYVVSLPQWEFNNAKKEGNIEPLGNSDSIFVLKEGLYDSIRGVPFGKDAGDWNYDPGYLIPRFSN